jgi:hypothetical protein
MTAYDKKLSEVIAIGRRGTVVQGFALDPFPRLECRGSVVTQAEVFRFNDLVAEWVRKTDIKLAEALTEVPKEEADNVDVMPGDPTA